MLLITAISSITSFPTTTQNGREQAVGRGMLSMIFKYRCWYLYFSILQDELVHNGRGPASLGEAEFVCPGAPSLVDWRDRSGRADNHILLQQRLKL